jgi:hypothetical protein
VPRAIISSDGVANLASSCKKLQSIQLRRCVLIEDSCIKSIAINCSRLNSLSIDYCPLITDKSLEYLGKYTNHLFSINLSGTNVNISFKDNLFY